ncbi:PREDICTED: uncharacterized protein LOC109354018 [Lupinus angustifolius]|uniref:uncharacterized protein LOC109354018 n=1 Tax=Lupinus angustifolius TaxID=3871 RepID=UPI00092FAA69|nr:PREDICTED: uncharacterized protein LOC109354018 [Lupinus angustifolius]
MVKAVFLAIDIELHVDHICFHPSGDDSMDQAVKSLSCIHPSLSLFQLPGATSFTSATIMHPSPNSYFSYNYNAPQIGVVHLPLSSSDIGAVQRIAKQISGRSGGLPSAHVMALAHVGGVIEVACDLLDPNKVGGERVQGEVEVLPREG